MNHPAVREMDLGEAKRRFEKILALQGYSTRSNFGWRIGARKKNNLNERYFLLPIPSIQGLRGILWPDLEWPSGIVTWWGYISLQVGSEGEFMTLTGGPINRVAKQSWAPPKYSDFLPTIEEVRKIILRWDTILLEEEGANACIDLADQYITRGESRKASLLLRAVQRGEFSSCTISEGLSLVQFRYAKSRTERFLAAQIWNSRFRNRLI